MCTTADKDCYLINNQKVQVNLILKNSNEFDAKKCGGVILSSTYILSKKVY